MQPRYELPDSPSPNTFEKLWTPLLKLVYAYAVGDFARFHGSRRSPEGGARCYRLIMGDRNHMNFTTSDTPENRPTARPV